tara:strand:+ start:885 stop:1100 length:216 start_codon:yes stop_codon:yes gene_type:complete
MSEYSKTDLEQINGRMAEIEKNLAIAQENIYVLSSQIKDTQRVLTKLAQIQNEMSRRMVQWPFIAVDANQK